MKKFIRNIVLFVFFFLVLNSLFSLFETEFCGNSHYAYKLEYFKENAENYNSVVFGSSRIFRQFIPSTFDKNVTGQSLTTFNLGAPGTFSPEIYYLYEKFITEDASSTVKYAFIELMPFVNISMKNIGSEKNYYWMNTRYFFLASMYALYGNDSLRTKSTFIFKYFLTYVYHIINNSRKILGQANADFSEIGHEIGIENHGFYSLDQNMNDSTSNKDIIERRRREFLEDTSRLNKRTQNITALFNPRTSKKTVNEIHLKKIYDLIQLSKQKGIELFFIIPPKGPNYEEILPLYQSGPAEHILEVAEPQKYTELYHVKNSFDIGHLNEKGAELFSVFLAHELNRALAL